MSKNTKKIDTALIGCGYWGTNIAKSLIAIKRAIYVYDQNQNNCKILKKRFSNFINIEKNLSNILADKRIKNVIQYGMRRIAVFVSVQKIWML